MGASVLEFRAWVLQPVSEWLGSLAALGPRLCFCAAKLIARPAKPGV